MQYIVIMQGRHLKTHSAEKLKKNKLAKLQATLVQNYELLADGGEV